MPRSASACSSPRLLITVPTTGPSQLAGVAPRARQNEQQLVPVHAAAQLIHHHHPVAVAVEREADLRTHARNRQLQQFRRRRAAAVVDVAAVRRAADRHDFRTQIGEHPRRDLVARAVRAVDDDLVALERHARRDGRGAELLIVRAAAVDAHRLAEALRFPRHDGPVEQLARFGSRARPRACCRCESKNLMPLSS